MALRISAKAPLAVYALLFIPAAVAAQGDAEVRVLDYIRDHLRPGRPLIVTELRNDVFTQPEERKALDRLYTAFFRIPLFVAQHQDQFGSPPSREVIAKQFNLHSAEAVDVLLQVMECDPRVPKFIIRNPKSREIARVDVERIRSDERFGQTPRQLGGMEGKPAPEFKFASSDGGKIDSATLRGQVTLLYIWFTGCPRCMRETPDLVTLYREFLPRGLNIVAANADRVLSLNTHDATRIRYLRQRDITFPVVSWTPESDQAYGHISTYPTIFLIDRKWFVAQQWGGYVEPSELRRAVSKALDAK